MRNTACDTASRCIAEAKEYKKQRWHKSHMEPDFKEGDLVLVSTLNFNNLKGPNKTKEDKLSFRKKNPTPPEIVEMEDAPGPLKNSMKARKIRLKGKEKR
ncbi:hypothetical protein O181_021862 [Austropuccinia psidii MF-1]|uniref:Uncharacterized protein n=1 Tax=Austropuccinia psidii MF-1 TaxID=1389203 RepID=A0A9Q3CGC3_9BASI|nr:hypothetical protein [Austropuccinia psidii MF-1]